MIEVVVGKAGLGGEELSWPHMNVDEIATLASTASLLGDINTFVLVGALNSERAEEFLALAAGLALSPHTFVFEEEKLLKHPTDVLKRVGVKITTHTAPKKTEAFNVFLLANMFAARDRKKFWLALLSAFRAEVAPEAVAGMLHWKVRDMLSKGIGGKYSPHELKKISRKLVSLYHDSHRGGGDLALLLEYFALTL